MPEYKIEIAYAKSEYLYDYKTIEAANMDELKDIIDAKVDAGEFNLHSFGSAAELSQIEVLPGPDNSPYVLYEV